jgi:Amt family ammonium transporter
LLWFGWFGFNGGSAISSGAWAANGFVVTNLAASAGGLTWMILDWIVTRKPTAVGTCAGVVAGLVAITPASGYVYPIIGVLCGTIASIVCFTFTKLKAKIMDDSLDAFSVHGIGGIVGCIFTGIFAAKQIPFDGAGVVIAGGWWNRHWKQLGYQIAGICATCIWSFTITLLILLILWKIPLFGWRVSEYEERVGLDISQHGEKAYVFDLNGENLDELYEGEDKWNDIVSMVVRRIKKPKKQNEQPATEISVQID